MKRMKRSRLRERREQRLEAGFEIAAVARAGEQRAEIEGEDLGADEIFGDSALVDAERESLGQRRLPDAGLADEDRVVLAPAREDVDRAVELLAATDQGIELAFSSALSEVRCKGGERIARARPPGPRRRESVSLRCSRPPLPRRRASTRRG